MTAGTGQGRWAPTHAHVRAVLAVGAAALGALLLRRPDLVVLVLPLLGVLVWSVLTRPGAGVPRAWMDLAHPVLREGERSRVVVTVERLDPAAELVAASVTGDEWVRLHPRSGARVGVGLRQGAGAAAGSLVLGVEPLRWGRRRLGPALAGAASPFGAFRWGPEALPEQLLRVVPQPLRFDSRAPAPHPRGIVGLHRAARRGEGSEFATVRPFQWGDRLRRIHWPRSLRTGQLHVTTTHAEQDAHVALVVDGHYDLGASGGVHGAPSSMDHSVRAAAAAAEHFAHQGDRVSLQVLSSRTPLRLGPGSGRRHARRLLETLAQVVPGPQERVDPRLLRRQLTPGCLVVLVSAMVSPDVLTGAAALARSGVSVLVVDSLVPDVEPPTGHDAVGRLAWRLRLLERDREIRRVEAAGVPVVPWHGPGSLDVVLTRLARRRGARG